MIRPTTIVGANSVALCRLAAARADGINVQWSHPRRDELVAETEAALDGRPFLRTAYTTFAPELLDPDHPMRRSMAAAGYDVQLATFDGGHNFPPKELSLEVLTEILSQ